MHETYVEKKVKILLVLIWEALGKIYTECFFLLNKKGRLLYIYAIPELINSIVDILHQTKNKKPTIRCRQKSVNMNIIILPSLK